MFKRKKEKIRTAEDQLADIAKELIKQNKKTARIKFILVIIILSYIIGITIFNIQQTNVIDDFIKQEQPFVAEVILTGIIADNGDINSDDTTELLEKAFSAKNSKAIILRLNSPGGSPVQSSQIYQNIIRLKNIYNKKIYVVIGDICTSGCYYIASSADGIYADKSSIVGSIGVIISSFGALGAMEKLGIKRRLYTAGKYKGMLDPFSPENSNVTAHIKEKILAISHKNFISDVITGRNGKLKKDDDVFNGLIWLGNDAQKLGLIDGIGDSYFVANTIINIKARIKFEKPKTFIEQIISSSYSIFLNNKGIKLQ